MGKGINLNREDMRGKRKLGRKMLSFFLYWTTKGGRRDMGIVQRVEKGLFFGVCGAVTEVGAKKRHIASKKKKFHTAGQSKGLFSFKEKGEGERVKYVRYN